MKKNIKKLFALTMALCLVFALAVSASAASNEAVASGGTATSAVTLSSTADGSMGGDPAATKMSVTVPTVLAVAVGTDGTVTTATDAKIVNNSFGAVKVSKVSIEAALGWSLTAFGTKAVYCSDGTDVSELIVCRVDDAVKVIFDRDSTLKVYDKIDVTITERAKAFPETEVIFYDISDLLEAQKDLNAIVRENQINVTVSDHLYGLVNETAVKAELTNHSETDTYKIEILLDSTGEVIAEPVELAPGKSAKVITLLEPVDFGNYDCTAVVTAIRDGKTIGTLEIETTLHVAYLWNWGD